MLSWLEYFALFKSNVRLEELAELIEQRAARALRFTKRPHGLVVFSNPICEQCFTHGIQRWEKMLLLDLEVRFKMFRKRFNDLRPHIFRI